MALSNFVKKKLLSSTFRHNCEINKIIIKIEKNCRMFSKI